MICAMQSDRRQPAADLRVKITLAIVAASTLVASTAVPAPRPALEQSSVVEPVRTSVAVLPMTEAAPPAGSAVPEDSPTPAARTAAEAPPSGASEATTSPPRRPVRLSAASLCLAPGSNPDCEATFNAALRSVLAPADVVVTASGSAEIVGPRGAEPLHFQKRAPWVRRLETIGKEGIPFVRIPRGPDHEVVVGINRKGVLGVSLRERRD
jgi:hypothetical protein